MLKPIFLPIVVFLHFAVCAQNEKMVEQKGRIIFEKCLKVGVDSVFPEYFPNEKALKWVFDQWVIESNDYEFAKAFIRDQFIQSIASGKEHNEEFSKIVINSVRYIPVSEHVFKGDDKVNVEKLEILFSAGKMKYIGYVGFFEFENRLWLYPEHGIKFEIRSK